MIEHRFGTRYASEANGEPLLWSSVEALVAARRVLRERVQDLVADWVIRLVILGVAG